MKDQQTIDREIKIWRAKKDLTQDELSQKADKLIKIEWDAVTNPTLDTVTKISEGLDICLDGLTK